MTDKVRVWLFRLLFPRGEFGQFRLVDAQMRPLPILRILTAGKGDPILVVVDAGYAPSAHSSAAVATSGGTDECP